LDSKLVRPRMPATKRVSDGLSQMMP